MALRVARISARLALFACALGTLQAAVAIRTNTGGAPDARFLWVVVPFLCSGVLLFTVNRRSLAPIWVAVGTCWGFVVLAAWSLGLFFAWAALSSLVAGLAHGVAMRAGWRLGLAPIWFLLGATGLCAVFLLQHQLDAVRYGGHATEAPLIIAGAWVFATLMIVGCVNWLASPLRAGLGGSR